MRQLISSTPSARPGCLVQLMLTDLPQPGEQLSPADRTVLIAQATRLIRQLTAATWIGSDGAGRLTFVLDDADTARQQLQELGQQIVGEHFYSGDTSVIRLTPAIGYVPLSAAASVGDLISAAQTAQAEAQLHNDLHPVCFNPKSAPPAPARKQGRLAERLNTGFQVATTMLLGLIVPFLIYVGLFQFGIDVTPLIYLSTVAILLITSYLIWYEGFMAIRREDPPAIPAAPYPAASAIIAAYLPNEAATIVETVEAFLGQQYPGPFQVIVAYNTPSDLPVEGELEALAQRDQRLLLIRVPGSTSKAQNINTALACASGAFVGIFDADHHPEPTSFARAWRWLSQGHDAVQGHCLIRNGGESWVTRLVAVEFETIYAVAHPGRARLHQFGIFGGSNGYWKTEVLRRIRMRPTMLTEDIDSSLRAVIAGCSIVSDPQLISRELAPLTLHALWNQRMRWAQGWFQVSLRHLAAALRSPQLSRRQKAGMIHLLLWREFYPWLSMQVVPVLAFWIWAYGIQHINLLLPIFVLTTLLTFSSGPGQVWFAYLLGAPEIRRHWRWYLFYLLVGPLFYSGLKNLISRVAVLKEARQEKQWKVTPRAARPDTQPAGANE